MLLFDLENLVFFMIVDTIRTTTKIRSSAKSLSYLKLFFYGITKCRSMHSLIGNFRRMRTIWGDDWSHSPFIRRSPSWGFLGFSSAVRQMPGDLYTAPRIISLSSLSLATDVTDATLVASGLWLGTRTEARGTATLTKSFLDRSPWLMDNRCHLLECMNFTYIFTIALMQIFRFSRIRSPACKVSDLKITLSISSRTT